MAEIIQHGEPRQRRTNIPKQRHLPEAVAIGQAAAEILVERYGGQDWIFQAVDAVTLAAQRCIEQLGQSTVTGNETAIEQGGQYRFPARTREELMQTQGIAADARTVGKVAKDPTENQNGERPDRRQHDGPVSWVL